MGWLRNTAHVAPCGTSVLVSHQPSRSQVPIIAPIKDKVYEVVDKPIASEASPEFIASLTETPELIRNVVIAGHLHHGKTTVRWYTSWNACVSNRVHNLQP